MADPKLVVALEARLNKFEKDLKSAGAIADREVRNIESRFGRMNPGAGGFLNKFAAGFVTATVGAVGLESAIRSIRTAVKQVDDLGDTAERIGISTDALQALKFALGQAGGSAEIADRALDKFADSVAEAALGGGYLAKVFEANQVSLKGANGELRSTEDLLVIFSRLVANTEGAANKLKITTDAFGRQAGPQMVTTLERIAREGLPAVIDAAKSAGVVLDKELIQRGDELEKQFNRVEEQVSAAFKRMAVTWGGDALLSGLKGIEIAFKNIALAAQLIELGRYREALGIVTALEAAKQRLAMGGGTPLEGPDDILPRTKVTVTGRKTVLPPTGGAASENAFQRAIAQAEKSTAVVNAETAAIDLNAAARERAKLVATLEAAAKETNTKAGLKNTEVTAAQRAEIIRVADAYEKAAAAAEAAKGPLREFAREAADVNTNLQNVAVDGLRSMEDALIDIGKDFDNAGDAAKKFFAGILEDLARLAIRQGITGPLSTIFSGMFSPIPGKASGGPVSAGSPYMVGERGPELFVPKSAGNIVPNSVMARGGMGGPNITLSTSIDARGSTMNEARLHQILNVRDAKLRGDIVPIMRQAQSRKIA